MSPTGAAIREGAAVKCWGVCERQALIEKIFNKIQVTCVGAHVMVKPCKESDHALIFM